MPYKCKLLLLSLGNKKVNSNLTVPSKFICAVLTLLCKGALKNYLELVFCW